MSEQQREQSATEPSPGVPQVEDAAAIDYEKEEEEMLGSQPINYAGRSSPPPNQQTTTVQWFPTSSWPMLFLL